MPKPTQIDQLREQVQEIIEYLNDSTVTVTLGRLTLPTDRTSCPRKVTFVPMGGGQDEPPETVNIQEIADSNGVATGKWAKPKAIKPVSVMAHIFAESLDVVRLLHNNVIEASDMALSENSIAGEWEWVTQGGNSASQLYKGAEYIRQSFTWRLYRFRGVVQLPPLCDPVDTIVSEGEMGTLTDFVHGDPIPFEE